jgi:type I restriction enzyme, S subunit
MSSDAAVTGAEEQVQGLVPRLRFPEFRDAGEWSSEQLGELVTSVTPPKKLPTSLYASSGSFPIIDQGQDSVCGWTDDVDAVIQEPTPLIVFGDHTCALKFIDFPFAQGADGIKILRAKSKISVEYLYQSLLHKPLVMEDYRRHFSILKDRVVKFPDYRSGEQQKIADCLSSLDAVIAAEGDRLAALKEHKKGLMQQLFPRPERSENGVKIPPKPPPASASPNLRVRGNGRLSRSASYLK